MGDRCDAQDCPTPEEPVAEGSPITEHSFVGYGYGVVFHPECCPGIIEGEPCQAAHFGHEH